MQQTGAQILVQALLDQGVDTIFGYPGGAVLNIYDAIYEKKESLRHITASHEQGAIHAADGYARAGGKTGVVVATSGPGATNLITGLATAFQDSVPLVAITGNVSQDLIGRDSFQEVDIIDISNPVVKHNFFIQDINAIPAIVKDAFEIANSGRKGPVLIDIPKDLTGARAAVKKIPAYKKRPLPLPDQESLKKAADLITNSKRPLIYAGGGVTFSDAADSLSRFAEKIQAPVCLSMMGLSAFPSESPLCLGLLGMHGSVRANRAVGMCDLLIAVGTRFSDRVTGNPFLFARDAKTIHIDIDPSEIAKNVNVHLAVVGEAANCLDRLTEQISPAGKSSWIGEISEAAPETGQAEYRQDAPDVVKPKDLILALRRAAGAEAIIVTDVGQHQMNVAQHYPFCRPRTFLSSCGLGTMGYGMGAANGAAAAMPDRPVVLVTGDGSFHMNLAELAVSVSEDFPVKVLVFNNQVLGMVYQWQTLFYGGRYSSTEIRRKTDFSALAEAFGAKGFRITTKSDIAPILEKVFAEKGPCVVDCRIDSRESVFPMVPPGASLDEMICSEKS